MKVFTRSIVLLIISASFINNASAFEADVTNTNATIAEDLNQDGNKPKAINAENPPGSLLKDLNADGKLDFITTDSNLGGVSIALGLGDGKFEQPLNFLTGNQPLSLKIKDFNKDNKLDVVATNFKQKTVTVLFGLGNGSFTQQKVYRLKPTSPASQSGQNNPAPTPDASAKATTPITKAVATISPATLEQIVNQKINAYRATRKLPALTLNATISNVARTHSQNMAAKTVPFGHQGFSTRVQTIAKTFVFKSAGENVAYNYGYSDPASVAVNGWLKSPGHLNNIIGNYTLTGIGVARNTKGEYYFTQIFWRR